MGKLRPAALGACLLLMVLGADAQGQTAPGNQAGAPAAGAPPSLAVPSAQSILVITRSTLLTLNDALRSGNFTVLRDLAAPGFQSANTAAKLSMIFKDLLDRRTDLAPVATASPQIDAAEIIAGRNMLHLKGRFPLPAGAVAFDLLFEETGGIWRLFGISVQPASALPSPIASDARPATPAAPGIAKKKK
jgi:hypothetical protein